MHCSYTRCAVPFALFLAANQALAGPCPVTGSNSDCGALIDIGQQNLTITFSGQGPYDGIDDTLVGVVNHSNTPVSALSLHSVLSIFGFDLDGITLFGAAGNPADSTGYAGPNVTYSNINGAATAGMVNFTITLGTGDSAYFGLENALGQSPGDVLVIDSINGVAPPTFFGAAPAAVPSPGTLGNVLLGLGLMAGPALRRLRSGH